ncbi:hypothetical protein [Arenibaculum pallidiluteum]|uniref:hypothetical protein n=1 Tax=Arenibaculum pallidiluteum TaxID=2812559 RepID=UPI001A95DB91|nr:hypothetical protein [Arenibaculum pallidiluteum]
MPSYVICLLLAALSFLGAGALWSYDWDCAKRLETAALVAGGALQLAGGLFVAAALWC